MTRLPVLGPYYPSCRPLDLTEEDRAELVRVLRETIEADRDAS
jgi:hypothetical protein